MRWSADMAAGQGTQAMAAWWLRRGSGAKFLLTFLSVFGAWTGWWWIDSARTCPRQEAATLHGLCLMQVRERAERGESAAQRTYGRYLQIHGREAEARAWQLRSLQRAGPAAP
ncbi:hypothetical protein I4I83_08450 [Acidovorax cattleyae]|nr:hypothetical protein C8240_04720 [Paracidovorax cattleyae]MBF9264581.1 hypothetical protein [Paracidovorax cattleyae]